MVKTTEERLGEKVEPSLTVRKDGMILENCIVDIEITILSEKWKIRFTTGNIPLNIGLS